MMLFMGNSSSLVFQNSPVLPNRDSQNRFPVFKRHFVDCTLPESKDSMLTEQMMFPLDDEWEVFEDEQRGTPENERGESYPLFTRHRWSYGSGNESGDEEFINAVRMSPSFQLSVEAMRLACLNMKNEPDEPSPFPSGSPPVSKTDLDLLRAIAPPVKGQRGHRQSSNSPRSRSLPQESIMETMRNAVNGPFHRIESPSRARSMERRPATTSFLRGYDSDGDI